MLGLRVHCTRRFLRAGRLRLRKVRGRRDGRERRVREVGGHGFHAGERSCSCGRNDVYTEGAVVVVCCSPQSVWLRLWAQALCWPRELDKVVDVD